MIPSTPRTTGLVSIVTPTLNAAAFIETTIKSVLAQTYPNIEHLVVDGGSDDGTIEIVERFADRIRLLRLPGLNQAAAVNAGFAQSRGEFFGFLNADDTFSVWTIESAVRQLQLSPNAAMAYAEADHIDDSGNVLGAYPVGCANLIELSHQCVICQPATLLRSEAFRAVGGLDERLNYAMDYDLWVRLLSRGASFIRVKEQWAQSRMHKANKTLGQRKAVYAEVFEVLRRHFKYVPFNWIHAYAGYTLDGRDHFFDPPYGTPARAFLTLLIGLMQNRMSPVRFLREYFSEMTKFHARTA